MTRVHLHGVTILADATAAMVTFPQGRPRRYFIRTTGELQVAKEACWTKLIDEAWAALEARTADPEAA